MSVGDTTRRDAGTPDIHAIRGFNYSGSWGSSGLDLWQHHDAGLMAGEIARGREHFPGWNVARWWLSHEAFQRDPDRFEADFEGGLSIFAQQGIRVIPVLFNRWRDPVCDFGGVSLDHIVPGLSAWNPAGELFARTGAVETDPRVQVLFDHYLRRVVGGHRNDPRVLLWDICNEPLMGDYAQDRQSPLAQAELGWLRWCYQTIKSIGAAQPLTVGNYPSVNAIELTEPISDVISFHPYYFPNYAHAHSACNTRAGFEALLDWAVQFAAQQSKALLASETVWGSTDDGERAELLDYTLGELVKRDIGFVVHALHHSLVADLHRADRGPVGRAGYMHFIEADGTLRAGHERFNFYSRDAAT